jgi:hypothetical protein
MAGIEIEIEKKDKDYVEMSPPEGFMVPEGLDEDATFETVTEWRLKPNGKMCVVSVDGVEVPQKDDKMEEVEEEEDFYQPPASGDDEFIAGMERSMRA